MARKKKPVNYIEELCTSTSERKQRLGETLKAQYKRWMETLALDNFLEFLETIMANKTEIGAAQFFGKFRALAFEEYVYRLLKAKIPIEKPLDVFWAEKCLIRLGKGEGYSLELDVSVGVKRGGFVDPRVVLDTKVELDSSRLKTAIASFAILKRWKPSVKCAVVYVRKELEDRLLRLAGDWADGIFQLNLQNNETEALLDFVAKCWPTSFNICGPQ